MNPSELFKIIPFTNKLTGSQSYRVTGWLGKKRIRENYSNQAEAVHRKQDLERESMNLEPLPAITTRLTADQAKEAEAAFAVIADQPFKLLELVKFACARMRQSQVKITFGQAMPKFLKSKTDAHAREDTIKNLRIRLKPLVDDERINMLVSQFIPEQLRPLIFREGSPTNRRNDWLAYSNFFNWAVQQEYCEVSPLTKIKSPEVDSADPEILPLDACKRLLAAALAYEDGILVPYITLCLFCAIRPDKEIRRISWDSIRLQQKIIRIGSAEAKTRTRGRRNVEISDNAIEFLTSHALEKTPIIPVNFRNHFETVRRLAGFGAVDAEHKTKGNKCYCKECCKKDGIIFQKWPDDVMRHTAGSFHYALNSDEAKTAKWMGNSPDVVHNHYKALIDDANDVKEFWNIRPSNLKGEIIEFKKIAQLKKAA